MWKKWMVYLVLLIGAFAFLPNATALAAPELKVSISVGIDGKAKYGEGAPVSITIENSGSAFSGDLVVEIPYSYFIGNGRGHSTRYWSGRDENGIAHCSKNG